MMLAQDVPLMMRRVYERGLTTSSGGNVSVRDADCIWITPSGIDKGTLKAEDVVAIKSDGTVSGKQRPSSEYPFHQAIYAARHDVSAIIHAHSPALVAYCIAHQIPDTRVMPQIYQQCGEIGYSTYVMPGSPDLAMHLAGKFAEGYQVVLMENHGVVVVAESLDVAYRRLEMITRLAQVLLHSTYHGEPLIVDNIVTVSFPDLTRLDLSDPTIAPLIERGNQRDLFITDMTAIWHDAVQNEYLIQAHPAHLMAFAVTHMPLDTRTIPEAYVTLHDVPLVDAKTASQMLAHHDAIIIKNDCVIVRGKTLLQAYDRLEVLEYTARSAIEAIRLGGVVPMSDAAIHELDDHYHRYYQGLSG